MKLNGNVMLDTMSDVDEKLIMESDFVQNSKAADKKIKKKFFITGAAITAVMAAAAIAVTFVPWKSENHVVLPDLPMLTVSEVSNEGNGFSAISSEELAKKKAVLSEQNLNISEMPVYNSSSLSDETSGKMKAKLKETVEYFGLDLDNMDISDNTFEENLKRQLGENYDNIPEEELERISQLLRAHSDITAFTPDDDTSAISYISISSDMCVHIVMDDEYSFKVPEEYSFGDDSTLEELEAAGRYLLDKYSGLVNMSDPVFSEYESINNGYTGAADFYENGTYPAEDIANQSIKHVRFIGRNNRLTVMTIYEEYTVCEKIADYPVITEEEAETLLRNGNYLSTINNTMYTLKEDDEIGLTRLTYRSGRGYECIMPFYLFYVQIPEEEFGHEKGDLLYGLFYVPAVRSEYLENMPEPAISFNGAMIK